MRDLMAAVTSADRSKASLGGDSDRRLNGQAPFHPMCDAKRGSAAQEDIQPEAARAARWCSATEVRKRQIREALADSDVFGALADDELDGLIKQGRTTTYSSGAVVFRKGDPAEDLMIVLDGRIKLSSASANGKEVIFDFIGTGRCFGEGALLDGKTRRLEATAVKVQRSLRAAPT